MAKTSPMDVLRELAEESLDKAVQHLGKMRQAHASAVQQRERLEGYQQEYRDQMQSAIVGQGMGIANLINYGAFITSLGRAVDQQTSHIQSCQHKVDEALMGWKKDKKRLNAFTTLKNRAESRAALRAGRLDQKLMDEFAQRASLVREKR